MIVVFFKSSGVVELIILDKQKTVTTKWYIEQYLPKVIKFLKNLRPKSRINIWILHHGSFTAHRPKNVTECLATTKLKLLEQPLCSPDLAPYDLKLFPHGKIKQKGIRFSSDDSLLNAWDYKCALFPNETWQS